MTELNRNSEARGILAQVLHVGRVRRLHIRGAADTKQGFRRLPSQSDTEQTPGARKGFATLSAVATNETIFTNTSAARTQTDGEISEGNLENRADTLNAVSARRILFPRLRRKEVSLGERVTGDTPTEGEVESLVPDTGGNATIVRREPRFKIRGFSDLRGPQNKRIALRPFINNRQVPHCPYHVPVWDGVSSREGYLEEREEARVTAVADTKVERNVRLSYGIEEIWRNIGEQRRDFFLRGSAAGIGRILYKYEKNAQGREVMTNEEVRRIPFITGEGEDGFTAYTLIREQRFLIDLGLRQWVNEREDMVSKAAPDILSEEEADYIRLKEITGLMNAFAGDKDYKPTHPYFLLLAGWNTAIYTIWGLYGVSPEAFEDKYDRKPTKKELDSLYASSEHIAASLAVGLSPLSLTFSQFLRDKEKEEYDKKYRETTRMHFKRENFAIEEVQDPQDPENTLPVLVIREERFTEFEAAFDEQIHDPDPEKRPVRTDEDATGCPALYAKGIGPVTAEELAAQQKVKHVISEVAQWTHTIVTELLDEYIQAPYS